MTIGQRFFSILAAALMFAVASGWASGEAEPEDSQKLNYAQLVKEVESGKRTTANAAWWGFDADDATECLQRAINSGAKKVIVPYMGRDWVVRPIQLASNQQIVFEPGVVVTAKKGAFKGPNDSLFSATLQENITLAGYGATLRMQKRDYISPDYLDAEWRMVLSFRSCDNVKILGLTLRDSGGDGIYLGRSGADRVSCRNVVIKDVVCDNNYRQGISVISAENLLIENCRLINTDGTPPEAGIDFEPNAEIDRLVNCVMRNCIVENNTGPGINVYLYHLSDAGKTKPVSILVENCLIKGSQWHGLGVSTVLDTAPKGLIEFRNCVVQDTRKEGALIINKSSKAVKVRFVNCKWFNSGEPGRAAPIGVVAEQDEGKKFPAFPGGIDFIDCRVYQQQVHVRSRNLPTILARGENIQKYGLYDIQGRITVVGPPERSRLMKLGPKLSDVTLQVQRADY